MTITVTRRPPLLAESFRPFGGFRREMERAFENMLGEPFGMAATPEILRMEGWSPLVDVSETDRELIVRAECPGIRIEDIEVSVLGNTLVISGEKSQESETGGEDWYRCERRFGSFRRTIDLPSTVEADRAQADAQNGVVTVHIPKRPEAKPRPIAITPKK